jgi:hypothetical protein
VLIDVICAFFEYRLRTKSCILPKISSEKYYLNSVGVNDFSDDIFGKSISSKFFF